MHVPLLLSLRRADVAPPDHLAEGLALQGEHEHLVSLGVDDAKVAIVVVDLGATSLLDIGVKRAPNDEAKEGIDNFFGFVNDLDVRDSDAKISKEFVVLLFL